MSQSQLQSNLNRLFDDQVFAKTSACGAIVMAGSVSGPYFEGAFGRVHKSSKTPISTSTLFDTQSITKVLATTSLLEVFLAQEKIRLDDNVKTYVPGFVAPDVRIRDLVLHQSGLSDEDCVGEFKSADELWRKMLSAPLRFKPGTSVEYADVGYRILGLALEKVGGADLDTLAKKFVWSVAGMNNTTYDLSSVDKELIAGGPNAWGFLDDCQDVFLGKPLGCDGAFSSGADIASFCRHWLVQMASVGNLAKWFECAAGEIDAKRSFYESLGLGRNIRGWEKHHLNQSYLGNRTTEQTIEKAGGAGAFISIRPDRGDYFIYLTNHGRPDPFTIEAWNQLVADLRVREIAEQVMPA